MGIYGIVYLMLLHSQKMVHLNIKLFKKSANNKTRIIFHHNFLDLI